MIKLGNDILTMYSGPRSRPRNWRMAAVIALVLGAFVFMGAWTVRLGVIGGRAQSRAPRPNSAAPTRADIIDRNGEILAKNVYSYSLRLDARKVANPDAAAAFIRQIVPEISVSDALAKIQSKRGDIELKRKIDKETALRVISAKIPGIVVLQTQTREYPKRNSTAHIVGYIDSVGNGIGVEKAADARLSSNAEPLQISLDARIQSVLWSELAAAMNEYKAAAAMGIIMNSQTGEIVAAASLPDFDPNPEDRGRYNQAGWRFRILRDTYELGSIFKIFNTALALRSGMSVKKTFNVARPFFVGGKKINEAPGFNPTPANMNVAQIMQNSCNSGSAQIALELPDGAQIDFFKELGFGERIVADFGETGRTSLPSSRTQIDRARWAFGHGISTTPLHAFLAANAVVNGGRYVPPTIYKRSYIPQTRRVVPADVSKQIRMIMYKTNETTGRQAANQIKDVYIGGKTSTAEKWIGDKYSAEKNITAYFVAFPIDAPKWSMLIIFDEPKGHQKTAAHNAVPTAGRILDAIIPWLQTMQ